MGGTASGLPAGGENANVQLHFTSRSGSCSRQMSPQTCPFPRPARSKAALFGLPATVRACSTLVMMQRTHCARCCSDNCMVSTADVINDPCQSASLAMLCSTSDCGTVANCRCSKANCSRSSGRPGNPIWVSGCARVHYEGCGHLAGIAFTDTQGAAMAEKYSNRDCCDAYGPS